MFLQWRCLVSVTMKLAKQVALQQPFTPFDNPKVHRAEARLTPVAAADIKIILV